MVQNKKIAIIGLGYVGLPLAVEFGKARSTLGFDISARRIDELRLGRDSTLEVTEEEMTSAAHLAFSCDVNDLGDCSIFIVT
jgi:UDP-N-acetyl-D-galactosamine dehydrogenase